MNFWKETWVHRRPLTKDWRQMQHSPKLQRESWDEVDGRISSLARDRRVSSQLNPRGCAPGRELGRELRITPGGGPLDSKLVFFPFGSAWLVLERRLFKHVGRTFIFDYRV